MTPPGAWIKQTKQLVMMDNEGSTKIVNFKTLWAGVLVLVCGHISLIVSMHYLLLYPYTTHWLLLYKGIIMMIYCAIADFYLLKLGPADMQIW